MSIGKDINNIWLEHEGRTKESSLVIIVDNLQINAIDDDMKREIVKRVNGYEGLKKVNERLYTDMQEVMKVPREVNEENMRLKAQNRELAKALEYIANDVTEETIAGGIRALKKYKGVE